MNQPANFRLRDAVRSVGNSIPAGILGAIQNFFAGLQALAFKLVSDVRITVFIATPIIAEAVDEVAVYGLGVAVVLADAAVRFAERPQTVIPKRR